MSENFFILENEVKTSCTKKSYICYLKWFIVLCLFLGCVFIGYCYYYHTHNDDIVVNVTFSDVIENTSNQYVELGEYVIPIYRNNNTNYIKIVFIVKLYDVFNKSYFDQRIYDIKDIVYNFFQNVSYDNFNHNAGLIALKLELLKRINLVLDKPVIESILIKEYVLYDK